MKHSMIAFAFFVLACGDPADVADADSPDGATSDAARDDGGVVDASASDAPVVDTGRRADTSVDVPGTPDAGDSPDARPMDGYLYFDDFESGDLSHVENDVRWCCNFAEVSDERANGGTYSLRFPYGPDAIGEDSWSEQRIELGRPLTDMWIAFDLYVPSNYAHRSDEPSNNKFFALYHRPYSTSGFSMNFTNWAGDGDGSTLASTWATNREWNGFDGSAPDFLRGSDPGWKRIVMHVRASTGAGSSDGVIQLWKDGASVIDLSGVDSWGGEGTNFFDEAYLLGWSNSGFTEETVLYIDNVLIAESRIEP